MLYAIVAVIALILDQLIKYWTTVNIVVDTGEAKLIPGLVHLANVHNTGAAFSFLEGARWFFVILCIIFVLIVVYALAKNLITDKVCRWAAVFVMAGAVGNCLDRILCGYVVDMFEFDFLIFKHPFPVFNLADIFITLGVIVFCVALLLEKPSSAAGKKAKPLPAQEKASAADASDGRAASAAAGAPAGKKRGSASARTRRTKQTQLPEFPKHRLAEVPPLDPNDPFAEWEKRANAPKPAAPEPPASDSVVYTQPAAAAPGAVPQGMPTEPAVRPAAPVRPKAPDKLPAQPLSSAAAPAKPASTDDFDLESILAEFKDL